MIEPAPLVTLMMRGVEGDLRRRGEKYCPKSATLTALVLKARTICSASVPGPARAMPALLTRLSSLGR